MSFPQYPYVKKPTSHAVAEHLHYFEENGALPVTESFTVASEDEVEFIYKDHRYLMAPHDDHYDRYATVLMSAGVPYVKADPELSDDAVIVGEISRDARTLPQVMRSKQPKEGEILADVFLDMGHTIGSIIQTAKIAPTAGSLALDRVLVLREESRVLLPPSVDFEVANEHAADSVASSMEQQLLPRYEKFGGQTLLAAFKEGLYGVDDNRG